jgi:hypothetical protein
MESNRFPKDLPIFRIPPFPNGDRHLKSQESGQMSETAKVSGVPCRRFASSLVLFLLEWK